MGALAGYSSIVHCSMIHKTVRKDETVKDLWEAFTVKLHSGRQKMKQVMRACACAILYSNRSKSQAFLSQVDSLAYV